MNIKRVMILIFLLLLSIVIVSCGETNTTAATTTATDSTTIETTTEATTETTTTEQTTVETTTEETTTQITTTESTTTTEETTLSDLQILQNAANTVIITNSDNILENFFLPAEVRGMTVVWESNNEDVVTVSANTTSVDGFLGLFYEIIITRPNQIEGTATVTITGTFYYNDSTYQKDFTLRVPPLEDSSIVTTIAAGLALDLGTYITWKDMTIYGIGDEGFFFTDGTDIMYVYNTTYLDTVVVGDVYDIVGSVMLHYDIPELANDAENIIIVTASTAASVTLIPTVATISEVIANHVGYTETNPMNLAVYTVTGKVYIDPNADATHNTYIIPSGSSTLDKSEAIRIYYKSNMSAVAALAGQTVTLDLLIFGYNSAAAYTDWYAYFLGESEDIQTSGLSDTDKLAISVAQLESSYDITTSFELPVLVYGDYTNVTISTEIAPYLTYSGGTFTVTRPDNDTAGTVTLTLQYNDESETITIDINMIAEVVFVPGDDLFISQYIEGTGYNKYIEIYNPLNSTVDLSEYTLELYSNGSATPTASMTLSGTLAPGEVIVIGNSGGTIYTADITNNSVINFNGDDAVVLKHNGEVVDSIGQVGFRPDSYWGDSLVATANMTLIRKSTITGGDTNPSDEYDPSTQWLAYAIDSPEGLGEHVME